MFLFLTFLHEFTENWNVSQLLRDQSSQSFLIIAKGNNDSDLYDDLYTYLLWTHAAKHLEAKFPSQACMEHDLWSEQKAGDLTNDKMKL